jgi:hypothetical protein
MSVELEAERLGCAPHLADCERVRERVRGHAERDRVFVAAERGEVRICIVASNALRILLLPFPANQIDEQLRGAHEIAPRKAAAHDAALVDLDDVSTRREPARLAHGHAHGGSIILDIDLRIVHAESALRRFEPHATAYQTSGGEAVPKHPANGIVDVPVLHPEMRRREQHPRGPVDRLEPFFRLLRHYADLLCGASPR